MSSPVIRQGTVKDSSAIAVLFDLYRQSYEKKANLVEANNFVEARLKLNHSIIFVAEVSANNIIGFVQLYPSFSSLSMAPTLILNDLFVREEYRRLKFAEKLIDAAHVYGRAAGAVSINLETLTTNVKAQALYEKLGYHRENDFFFYACTL